MSLIELAPLDLFLTGHAMTFAGIYFNQVLLLSELIKTGAGPEVQPYAQGWQDWLKQAGGEFVGKINLVNETLLAQGLAAPERPRFPDDYFSWVNQAFTLCHDHLDTTDMRSMPFTYGYGLGEVSCDLVIWQRSLDINIKLGFDNTTQIQHTKNDLKNVLFRWNASASLLGTNEKYHPIWQEWKKHSDALAPLLEETSSDPEVEIIQLTALLDGVSAQFGVACDCLK